MSIFLDWLLGRLDPKAPAPTPAPSVTPPAPQPIPSTDSTSASDPTLPQIKLETWNRTLLCYRPQEIPFRGSSEITISRAMGRTAYSALITVVSGTLPPFKTVVQGPHNPRMKISPIKKSYGPGDVLTVKCLMGPRTSDTSGSWDNVLFGLHSPQLGEIFTHTAVVTYPKK